MNSEMVASRCEGMLEAGLSLSRGLAPCQPGVFNAGQDAEGGLQRIDELAAADAEGPVWLSSRILQSKSVPFQPNGRRKKEKG